MAGGDVRRVFVRAAVAQEEHHQRLVVLGAVAHHPAIGHGLPDRRALDRAGEGAVFEMVDPALHRRVPGIGEAFRAGPGAQLVERLHAPPDMPRRLADDAGGGEMGDEGALLVGRDRIAARSVVEIGRKAEQRIVRPRLRPDESDGGSRLPRNGAGGGETGGALAFRAHLRGLVLGAVRAATRRGTCGARRALAGAHAPVSDPRSQEWCKPGPRPADRKAGSEVEDAADRRSPAGAPGALCAEAAKADGRPPPGA